jgi:hypothetical protein
MSALGGKGSMAGVVFGQEGNVVVRWRVFTLVGKGTKGALAGKCMSRALGGKGAITGVIVGRARSATFCSGVHTTDFRRKRTKGALPVKCMFIRALVGKWDIAGVIIDRKGSIVVPS